MNDDLLGRGEMCFPAKVAGPLRDVGVSRCWMGWMVLVFAVSVGACTAEELFVKGRVMEPCSAVYPTCHVSYAAGCYLDDESYTRGNFPGARRILVATTQLDQTIRVRLLLTEMLYPGTEILVQAYEPDCGNVARDLRQGVDVFEEAGDDRILLFDVSVETPGDHLVELYSDCAADYLLTAQEITE